MKNETAEVEQSKDDKTWELISLIAIVIITAVCGWLLWAALHSPDIRHTLWTGDDESPPLMGVVFFILVIAWVAGRKSPQPKRRNPPLNELMNQPVQRRRAKRAQYN